MKASLVPAFCLVLAGALAAQTFSLAPKPEPRGLDELGRETPRGAVLGFLRAAQRDRYEVAARFLQLTDAARNSEGPRLARQLRAAMDSGYGDTLDFISARPEGNPDDGMAPGEDHAGAIQIGERRVDVVLIRVNDPRAGMIWLISHPTVIRAAALYEFVGFPAIEERLPRALVDRRLLSMPLWQWLAALLFAPVALGLGWLLFSLVGVLFRRYDAANSSVSWKTTVGAPLAALLAMLAHLAFVDALGVPLLYRHYYLRVVSVSFLLALAWLLWRLIDRAALRAVARSQATGERAATSLFLLGKRILKAFLVVAVVLAILSTLGYQMSGVIAGLGLGGVAVALAAQKTIENLLGGVSLVSDEVFRVGDIVKLADKTAVVEDIGLRSTRLRTPERAELSIPNGVLAGLNIENLSRRDCIVMHQSFLLVLDTRPALLRATVERIRALVLNHPRVVAPDSRVRLIGVEDAGHRVEVYAVFRTTDPLEFQALREEVLFELVSAVEAAGTRFASRVPLP